MTFCAPQVGGTKVAVHFRGGQVETDSRTQDRTNGEGGRGYSGWEWRLRMGFAMSGREAPTYRGLI